MGPFHEVTTSRTWWEIQTIHSPPWTNGRVPKTKVSQFSLDIQAILQSYLVSRIGVKGSPKNRTSGDVWGGSISYSVSVFGCMRFRSPITIFERFVYEPPFFSRLVGLKIHKQPPIQIWWQRLPVSRCPKNHWTLQKRGGWLCFSQWAGISKPPVLRSFDS